ncbi:hypothetical protein BDQ12DRAFT_730192 [Crucibulum laeve]|uniref:Uncharacterized protein n=1 Tax=Crucibulum laeve TaxID=68775 RepID=A0A5C3MFA0_9AGAR|nr:hypothetical protein BDQ12DRAFT_730192 [Crucibulum laeve]
MLFFYPLVVALFQVLCIQVAYATDQHQIWDHNGKSPCDINQAMSDACQSQTTRSLRWRRTHEPRDALNPTPSLCTCNNVFFNLLSACSKSRDVSLPDFNDWKGICQNFKIDLVQSYAWVAGYSNVDIPPWAYLPVPQNSTFNVQIAQEIATRGQWSKLQILLPVITAGGLLVCVGVAFLIYRWKRIPGGVSKWPATLRHSRTNLPFSFPRTRSVHHANRSNTWTIDTPPDATSNDYVFVDVPSPTYQSQAGHDDVKIASPIQADVRETPFAQTQDAARTSYGSEWRSTGTSSWRNLRAPSISLPWKKKLTQVKEVPLTRRFNVYEEDHSTEHTGSRPTTANFSQSHKTTTENGGDFSRHHGTIYEDEEDEGMVPSSQVPGTEDEHTSLISHQERRSNDVFLISRGGRDDFTIESGSSNPRSTIQVISPTATSQTHSVGSSAPIQPHTPTPASPPRIPPVPPAPTQRAPLPPVRPRRGRSPDIHPLAQSSQPLHQSPQPTIHPLPTLPRSPPPLHAPLMHTRKPSDPIRGPRPRSQRKPSDESLYTDHTSQSSMDHFAMLSPPLRPGQLSDLQEELISRTHTPQPRDGHIRASPALHPRLLDEANPLRRTPSPNGGSYSNSRSHSRNVSTENIIPARSDPVMLFPGSVRAVGYGGPSPNVSSDNLYHDPYSR